MKLPDTFVIFDTEFTAWEGSLARGWSNQDEYREIVQIGAVKVSKLETVEDFLVFVRPEKNPVLSEYFIELTKITQEQVDDSGISFDEALEKFYEWSEGLPFYSYGPDGEVIKENIELLGNKSQFDGERFNDIRDFFGSIGIHPDEYSSGSIPKAFGETPPPDAHNALNDAQSILIALQAHSKKSEIEGR